VLVGVKQDALSVLVDHAGEHVVLDALRQRQTDDLAVLRQVADAAPDGVAEVFEMGFLAVDEQPASVDRVGAHDGARNLGAPGAGQAADGEDLAAVQREIHMVEEAPAGVILHAENFFPGHRILSFRIKVLDRLAAHLLHQHGGIRLRNRKSVHQLAVPHNGDHVRDFEDLRQVVRNIDDGKSLFLECAEDREQPLHFLRGQRGGRFVHNQDGGRRAQHLGNFDQLRVTLADLGHVERRIEMIESNLGQQLARLFDRFFAVDKERVLFRQPSNQQIFTDGNSAGQAQLLIDHPDTGLF